MKTVLAVASPGELPRWSWLQLGLIFVLALLLFITLRWQPEPWLRSEIEVQAARSGVTLHYERIKVEGLTARLDQVVLQAPGLARPLEIDSLMMEPSWASLFKGAAGIHLLLNWRQQSGEALLIQGDSFTDVQNIKAELDMSVLQGLLQGRIALPVRMGGRVLLTGDIRLDQQTGHPQKGKLVVSWESATLEMTGGTNRLGDYQLAFILDGAAGSWQWLLDGGDALLLSGEGAVAIPTDVGQPWAISGQTEVKATKDAGILAAMLGSAPMQFTLSGNMANPRFQRL